MTGRPDGPSAYHFAPHWSSVDGRGRTLYLFARDRGGHRGRSGACAAASSLTVHGQPGGAGLPGGKLGTTHRRDGRTQVTYAGHSLATAAACARAG